MTSCLWSVWSVTPEQLAHPQRWSGEHALVLAVIADALKAATTSVNHSCRERFCPHTHAREQARRWLMSDSERAYGFVWCCAHVDADPETLRRLLRESEVARSVA